VAGDCLNVPSGDRRIPVGDRKKPGGDRSGTAALMGEGPVGDLPLGCPPGCVMRRGEMFALSALVGTRSFTGVE
jgi:hypothetical protein